MPDREFGCADTFLRGVVATACAWEVVAITTRKVPTVSRISRRHPWFAAAVTGVLVWHFRPLEPPN